MVCKNNYGWTTMVEQLWLRHVFTKLIVFMFLYLGTLSTLWQVKVMLSIASSSSSNSRSSSSNNNNISSSTLTNLFSSFPSNITLSLQYNFQYHSKDSQHVILHFLYPQYSAPIFCERTGWSRCLPPNLRHILQLFTMYGTSQAWSGIRNKSITESKTDWSFVWHK